MFETKSWFEFIAKLLWTPGGWIGVDGVKIALLWMACGFYKPNEVADWGTSDAYWRLFGGGLIVLFDYCIN